MPRWVKLAALGVAVLLTLGLLGQSMFHFQPAPQGAAGLAAPAPMEPDNPAALAEFARAFELWQQQHRHQAIDALQHASALGASQAPLFLEYAQNWQRSVSSAPRYFQAWSPPDCLQQILFVTAELSALKQASDFIKAFNLDSRLASLPLCVAQQVLFVPDSLNCPQVDQQTRISCDLGALAEQLAPLQFSHLVIFSRQGKANVHNGIMYLDQHDSYDVLVHELAHFAGFVDEYPLSAELASRVCEQGVAPNLLFQPAGQSLNQHYWQQIGLNPPATLSRAQTCDNHTTQAYKASSELTFMEYYDVASIPPSYIQAWRAALQYRKNLTPAYLNLAQWYEQQRSPEAVYWRKRYEAYVQHPM